MSNENVLDFNFFYLCKISDFSMIGTKEKKKVGRMFRFLRICTFLSFVFFSLNAFAAGYTCDVNTRMYTSCNATYYLSNCGSAPFNGGSASPTTGNDCLSCPSGYTCSGGTACPVPATTTVKCSAGNYIKKGATTCSQCPAGSYCAGGTYTISSAGADSDTGITSCPAGSSSVAGSSARSACSCNAGYGGNATTGSCTVCAPGYYKTSAGNTSCSSCGSGYFCTGGTHRATCASTVKSGAPTPNQIISVSNGSWSDYEHATSSNDCMCDWHFSDDSTTWYLQQSVCSAGPTSDKYRHYVHCRTGYYAADPLNWGEWYTSCKACTTKPSNATYTSYSTPSVMYAVEDNCPWDCDANYYKSGNSCVACSTVSYTETGSETCTMTNGAGTRTKTRTCYRANSSAGSTSASACTGTSSCGSYSYGTCMVTSCDPGYKKDSEGTKCEPIKYTVEYNGNSMTGGSTASSSYTYGVAKALTLNGFTKTGYSFAGWATSATGDVVYTDGQSVTNLSSTNGATVTLYAKWTPNTYECDPGYYLNGTSCSLCDTGYYCVGGSLTYNGGIQGRVPCSDLGTGYTSDGGVSAKTKASCYLSIQGGYVRNWTTGTATTQCSEGTFKAAHKAYYGTSYSCDNCTGATYADKKGMSACEPCPTVSGASGYGYWNTSGEAGDHKVRAGCQASFRNASIADGNLTMYSCYVDASANTYGVKGDGKGCWVEKPDLTCNGGYYNKTFNDSTSVTQDFTYKTSSDLLANVCRDVESGYWSGADSLTRTACATGLTTCGSGKCANEAADCGRKLHAGDKLVHLRSAKRDAPALHVKIGNQTFYGMLGAVVANSLRVKNGSNTYSVINDNQ